MVIQKASKSGLIPKNLPSFCHQHPQGCTHKANPPIKIVFKTTIYTIKLDLTVDNLCNCVEKIEDKSVLRFLLVEGLPVSGYIGYVISEIFTEGFIQPLFGRNLCIQPT
jgi:hypothetical protein